MINLGLMPAVMANGVCGAGWHEWRKSGSNWIAQVDSAARALLGLDVRYVPADMNRGEMRSLCNNWAAQRSLEIWYFCQKENKGHPKKIRVHNTMAWRLKLGAPQA